MRHPSRSLGRAALALAAITPLASQARAQFVLNTEFGRGMDDAEITHDGKYAIVRENSFHSTFRFYELGTGSLIQSLPCGGDLSGACQDAIALSDTRAVLIGSCTSIVDLTALPNLNVLATHATGWFPRDVAVTPDGSIAAVRGGSSVTPAESGLFLFDLATGAQIAHALGEPTAPNAPTYSFDVDSVVASDAYAVFLSLTGTFTQPPRTRVTIFDLHPSGGGPPVVVFETGAAGGPEDQFGAPHDVALAPDGSFAAVRSELSVGVYELSAGVPTRPWHKRLWGDPGPFGNSALDSIEVSNSRIATISRASNGPLGAQIDVFDRAGHQWFARIDGDPHDLAVTPDGTKVLAHTHLKTEMFDLVNLPAGNSLVPLDTLLLFGSNTSYSAGLDSIVATNEQVVVAVRQGENTAIRIAEIDSGTFQNHPVHTMPDRLVDLDVSPDGSLVAIGGTDHAMVIDLRTYADLLSFSPIDGTGQVPWCDGVALDDEHAVAFGYSDTQDGWVTLIDLFRQPQSYCSVNPNSSGQGCSVFGTGSASIAKNDLELWATSLPQSPGVAQFFYGTTQTQSPFGDGFLCVSGTLFRFPPIHYFGADFVSQVVDYNGTPNQGGAISAGSTWNFQVYYRDPAGAGGSGFNLSDAVSVTFAP